MRPITYLVGDATQPEGVGIKIIAHCCNNIGAWGAGFVLAITKRWSQPEDQYLLLAEDYRGRIPLGQVQFVKVEEQIAVANIIAQEGIGWRRVGGISRPPLSYQALCDGLNILTERARRWKASVHMPRIGCGLAGGDWDKVSTIIEATLCAKDIEVFIYEPPLGSIKVALSPRTTSPEDESARLPEPALA